MKLALQSLMVGASLLAPFSALAHGFRYEPRPIVEGPVAHAAAPLAHRPPTGPPGRLSRYGRYELRSTRRWIPGHHVQVWIPQSCRPVGRGRTLCRDGHYIAQWAPGAYQQTQEWVWIPTRPGGRFLISASF